MERALKAQRMTSNAQRDLRNVTHPNRHPIEVARQTGRVQKFTSEAAAQVKKVDAANAKIRVLFARDVTIFPGATVGGAALMAASPPNGKEREGGGLSAFAPAKGWPKDVRMDLRVIGYSNSVQG